MRMEDDAVMDTILIVEDDEKLRGEMAFFLEHNGYEAKELCRYETVVEDILASDCDLVLLDINLPVVDGQYVCREVRRTSDVPIIMVTSRNSDLDQLISMNYGADDYVEKPFHPQILLARIAAILRRMKKGKEPGETVDCGGWWLDIPRRMAGKGARSVELTKNEWNIVFYLASRRNTLVSRDALMTHLWDSEMFVDDNTLTVNVARIRTKLEEIGVRDVIKTRRGQGYLMEDGGENEI